MWDLIGQCLDCLLPDSKHLFGNRQFVTAYDLSSEALETHKTM